MKYFLILFVFSPLISFSQTCETILSIPKGTPIPIDDILFINGKGGDSYLIFEDGSYKNLGPEIQYNSWVRNGYVFQNDSLFRIEDLGTKNGMPFPGWDSEDQHLAFRNDNICFEKNDSTYYVDYNKKELEYVDYNIFPQFKNDRYITIRSSSEQTRFYDTRNKLLLDLDLEQINLETKENEYFFVDFLSKNSIEVYNYKMNKIVRSSEGFRDYFMRKNLLVIMSSHKSRVFYKEKEIFPPFNIRTVNYAGDFYIHITDQFGNDYLLSHDHNLRKIMSVDNVYTNFFSDFHNYAVATHDKNVINIINNEHISKDIEIPTSIDQCEVLKNNLIIVNPYYSKRFILTNEGTAFTTDFYRSAIFAESILDDDYIIVRDTNAFEIINMKGESFGKHPVKLNEIRRRGGDLIGTDNIGHSFSRSYLEKISRERRFELSKGRGFIESKPYKKRRKLYRLLDEDLQPVGNWAYRIRRVGSSEYFYINEVDCVEKKIIRYHGIKE